MSATMTARLCLCVLVLAPLIWAQGDGSELEGRPVRKITIEGLRQLGPDAVLSVMSVKVGAPFSRAALDRDVRRLSGWQEPAPEDPLHPKPPVEAPRLPKLFAVIPSVLAVDDGQGGVNITLIGEENRKVVGLVFLGALEYGREELLPVIRTRAGHLVDDFTLELDRREMERWYRERGFHYVSVQFQKTPIRGGDLIIFNILEGVKVKIRAVHFEGLERFDREALLEQMPWCEEPGLLFSKEFVLEQVQRDVVGLNAWLRGQGHLDAHATLMEWRPTPDHERVEIFIRIEEGRCYTVRSLRIEGVARFVADEVQASLKTVVGGPYATAADGALGIDIKRLTERYQEEGLINAQVTDRSTIDLDSDQVDVVIHVTEGELVHVGAIEIRGNVETQDRVIRREIDLVTGDALNLKKLRRSEQKIRSLRYWSPEQGVRLETPEISFGDFNIYREAYVHLRDTRRENVQDIVIDVQEADTGSVRFAVGVSTNAGVIGDITYTKTNFDPLDVPEKFSDTLEAFTGGGQTLVLSFQPGTIMTRGRVLWGDQHVFDSPYALTGELYLTEWLREDWREGHEGVSVTAGRLIGDDLRVDVTLRDEVAEVSEIENGAPQIVWDFEGRNEVASVQVDARLRRVDNFLEPTEGREVELSLKYAGLWGSLAYWRGNAGVHEYVTLLENAEGLRHVLQLNASVGWAAALGDTRDVPIFDRLFAGGTGTIRGFRYRGAGPHENGAPIGGKAMWLLGAEYLFPIEENQLRGVVFLDSGSVGEDWASTATWEPRVAVGAGVRLVIPFLGDRPVAIDFGIPLLKQDGDETQLISFSFGHTF
jgi:outer membrane protein assembly complex protein YaeT